MKTYKIRHLKGIVGDFGREYWTDEDHRRHEEYVEELKRNGEYLKPEILTFSLVENPSYDSPKLTTSPLQSASMVMLDFSTPIEFQTNQEDISSILAK